MNLNIVALKKRNQIKVSDEKQIIHTWAFHYWNNYYICIIIYHFLMEDSKHIIYIGFFFYKWNAKRLTTRKMKRTLILSISLLTILTCNAQSKLTSLVNPFLGTATLWDKADLHYDRKRKSRTWGGETFPGSSVPNAMVQLSPVKFAKC